MKFDYSKLRGRITERFGSISKFCERNSISPVSFSRKLNNVTAFSVRDIIDICNILEIAQEEIGAYFFEVADE